MFKDPRNIVDDIHCALGWAAGFGHLDVVNCLLKDTRVNPSHGQNSPIRDAAANGHLPIIERLLEDPRVNPSDANNEAYQVAALRGYSQVVDRLKKDPRLILTDAVVDTCRFVDDEDVHLAYTISMQFHRQDHESCLRKAARCGHARVVKLVLSDPRFVADRDDLMMTTWTILDKLTA